MSVLVSSVEEFRERFGEEPHVSISYLLGIEGCNLKLSGPKTIEEVVWCKKPNEHQRD